jgi:Protein of unknown function (DUF3532).
MSSWSARLDKYPSAASVAVDREWLRVDLRDGRRLAVPTSWFDWLAAADDGGLADFEIIEGGQGIWWNTIDEGLSVPMLFGLSHR